jgi:hypothetical protein
MDPRLFRSKTRHAGAPWGTPANELPAFRERPLRRQALAVVVLVLTALALVWISALLGLRTSQAHSAPPPSLAIVSTTIPATPDNQYVPTPAGPPPTNTAGAWIPEPDQPPAVRSATGGGR